MEKFYSNERSVLILVSLLKKHNIKKIIASPGTTNLSFVVSLQADPFFEIYSCVDERSAAYMAVGMAAESGEPVVITCTGATASRNYPSALTEAYYRKLPILAVTGTQDENKIGHLHSQLIDRRVIPNDVVKYSVYIPAVRDDEDAYYNEIKINQAICELKRHGGGPVHINLHTVYARDFSVKTLPDIKAIKYYSYSDVDNFPKLPSGRIGVFIGSHHICSPEFTRVIDNFCASHDAVCFCDVTSGYYGKYRFNYSLLGSQEQTEYASINHLNLCIHIGEISAEYASLGNLHRKETWRVSLDGEMRDQFRKLTTVFELDEVDFFRYYTSNSDQKASNYIKECFELDTQIRSKLPEIPFSNIWIASVLHDKLPKGSTIHLGVLNSIRSWNLFQIPSDITSFANVGGFGIDGCVSSMIGASIATPNKLFFGVFGDLAFFYDMNSIGNRHVANNVRILVVNNGRGQEFRNHYHTGALFGGDADKYIAAAGHFGSQSHQLLKNYAENLGFEYLSASNKEEFNEKYSHFITEQTLPQPILFECFTETHEEAQALKTYWNIDKDIKNAAIHRIIEAFGGKAVLKNILGKKGVKFFRTILNKKN